MPKIVTESFCGCDANSWRSHRDILLFSDQKDIPDLLTEHAVASRITSHDSPEMMLLTGRCCHLWLTQSWEYWNLAGSTDQPQTCCLFPFLLCGTQSPWLLDFRHVCVMTFTVSLHTYLLCPGTHIIISIDFDLLQSFSMIYISQAFIFQLLPYPFCIRTTV